MSVPDKRLHTLLTDRAIAGLDEAQQAELRHLLVGAAIDPSYESAAAAIELSLMAHAEQMPPSVKAAVIEQASLYWGFMIPRRHEQTIGGRGSGLGLDASDELLLGAADSDAEPDDGAAHLAWDDSDSPESVDAAVESGVLESSLTNGRIDRGAKPSESQRAAIPADLNRLEARSGSGSRRPESDEPGSEPGFESGSHEDLDPRAVSQSDLGPTVSRSGVVPMPVSESRLARVATYVSALAALVMLSIAVWLFVHRDDPPDADDLRSQIEAASDKLEWRFVVKPDPAAQDGAGGSVLWSSEQQAGMLSLHGLAATGSGGSGETQYQVWIVDDKRDGPPVNGGVFDVEAGADEVQVPIDAKLVIGEPSAFVITVERPGGVVVSTQDRVVMVATGP
ncbi:anti-sigma factor [Enhygromyxa salina]|uniref:Anti-sigma-K factor rskA n=1 Tax=Enhygromyxa salina TaxID=215803 RepID=A0A2S9YND4_9BACT|nr:anti-sigma factor [Enhygromyxa salina]PRQ06592.1 Anti-sigma-K factor rskA [Enhygromyxa salina]